MSLALYQFPISHYCEKVRFAMDYKGIDYRVINLVPGLHARTTTRLARRSSVPVVDHDGRIVQGSAAIISYLDGISPDKRLTPIGDEQRQEAVEWERWLDNGVGIDVRRYCYHYLLPHRQMTTGLLTAGSPFKGRLYLLFVYNRLARAMRELMDINDEAVAGSLERLDSALDRLADHYRDNDFLVGGSLSRADIAAAALFAPMFQPEGYGLAWPDPMPAQLRKTRSEMAPRLTWAERIYRDHRPFGPGVS